MTEERQPSRRDPRWLTLGDASRLLGVSTATVRRWADSGRLKPFTTPGGHRRFSQAALERMLPTDRSRRPDIGAGALTSARLSRAYRRDGPPVAQGAAWISTLDAADRDTFRQLGRRLAWALIAHLDAAEADFRQRHLGEATALAAEYGRRGADLHLAMSDVVEGFLAFRRPFLAEVGAAAARRGFDAAEVTALFEDAERALDRLLVATMSGHSIRAVKPSVPAIRPLRDPRP